MGKFIGSSAGPYLREAFGPANCSPQLGLARRLSVARTTVIVAYDRLSSEGFVSSRVGSGTFVSEHAPPPRGGSRKPQSTVRSGPGLFGTRSRCLWPLLAPLNTTFAPVFRTAPFFHMTSGEDCFRDPDRKAHAQPCTVIRTDTRLCARRLRDTSVLPAEWRSLRKMSYRKRHPQGLDVVAEPCFPRATA